MKTVKKAIFVIVTILLLLVFLFNIYNFIQIKVLKKDLATINGYAVLEVVSGSMEPTIKIGDYVIIDTKEKNYQKDDIVTFYDMNGSFVTHRIVSIDGDSMITKGDNNNTEDTSLPTENIVGKYVMRLNSLGIIVSSLQKPFVTVMILIIGILVCFLVSTDKDGNPILEEEEKEYQEFLAYKSKKEKEASLPETEEKTPKKKLAEPKEKATTKRDVTKKKSVKKEDMSKEKTQAKKMPTKKKQTRKTTPKKKA